MTVLLQRSVALHLPLWKMQREKYFLPMADAEAQAYYDGKFLNIRRRLHYERLWSEEQCCECEHSTLASKVEIMSNAGGVRRAVQILNTTEGHAACPEGICVVYSQTQGKQFLLFRRDCLSRAQEVLGGQATVQPPSLTRTLIPEEEKVIIGSHDAIITAESGIEKGKVITSKPFTDWVASISNENRIEILKLHIQSVDMFGKKVGFIKFKAEPKVAGKDIPGIVFMRGGAVAVLVVLLNKGRKYTLVVKQARVPVCHSALAEIPAGMLDGDGNFAGVAAKELKEETGLEIKQKDLIDLTRLAYKDKYPGMYPSCGGSDEFNRIFLFQKTATDAELAQLQGKLTGVVEEGEMIKLEILELDKLWRVSPDAKALAALCLYRKAILEAKITAEPGISIETVRDAPPFMEWLASISKEKRIEISSLHVQSLDMFGPKVGFIKFKAEPKIDGKPIPGIVFMRGGSVAVLVILKNGEQEFALVVKQPRVSVCLSDLVEIPAGMLDGSGNFAGVAAKELKEETGIEIKQSDLVDMTEIVYGDNYPGMYPSCGGSDEFNRLYLFQKDVTDEQLKDLDGKLTGVAEEGEMIKLKILPFKNLWRASPDAKSLAALCLYEKLAKMGRIPNSLSNGESCTP